MSVAFCPKASRYSYYQCARTTESANSSVLERYKCTHPLPRNPHSITNECFLILSDVVPMSYKTLYACQWAPHASSMGVRGIILLSVVYHKPAFSLIESPSCQALACEENFTVMLQEEFSLLAIDISVLFLTYAFGLCLISSNKLLHDVHLKSLLLPVFPSPVICPTSPLYLFFCQLCLTNSSF